MNLHDSHEWVLWQAKQAVGETAIEKPVKALAAPILLPRKRKKHWAGPFQVKFAHWLKGDGERPCDLGYTRRELIRHLQRQFSKGMTWENYAGNRPFKSHDVWVVDHIVPKRLYSEQDAVHAYALSNLRPLWIADNMSKGVVREHLL